MYLRRQRFNCAHDVVVAGTAADVTGEVVTDFTLRRIRVSLEQLADAHDHTRRAEAALQCVVFVESRLNRMQYPTARRETFDCRDRRSIRHHRENRTGFDGQSIDIDGAGAALRRVATDVRSRETEIVSQHMNQKLPRFDGSRVTEAINVLTVWCFSSVSIIHSSDSEPRSGISK
jgi:hypothetical protein